MQDINAQLLDDGSRFECDLCIIGGGAAGLAIATEFINTRHKVLVLESGAYTYDDRTQSLYEFKNTGHPIRAQQGYISRNRYLGGSTNSWHGRCATLNDIDFKKRDWIPDSGWPITRQDLDLYYGRASRVLRLPDDKHLHLEKLVNKYRPEFFDDTSLKPQVYLLANTPVNMRKQCHEQLRKSENIQIFINANVTEIESDPAENTILGLHVSSLAKNVFQIKARFYILACGGLENARIMLLSNRNNPAGLANKHDNVGRYYMEHPKIISGKLIPESDFLKSPVFFWKKRLNKDGYVRLTLQLPEQTQAAYKLPNHCMELRYPQSLQESVATSESLLRSLGLSQKMIHKLIKISPRVFQTLENFERVIFNLPLQLDYISIFNHLEQYPCRDSRVMLGEETDALGQRRLNIKLVISEEDKLSIITFQNLIGEILERHGLGRIINEFPRINDEWDQMTDSSHHMGTTRMSLDPVNGVVDQNCRVHGLDNLFVASSSVFPAGGHVNPTLTIVAISLRLAAHLKEQLH